MRDTERGRDIGRGRSRLCAGSPGPWDHNLTRRQMLNCWATQAPLILILKKERKNHINSMYQKLTSIFQGKSAT